MDMKRILQAIDGVSTKPVVGASDMAKFLSIVDKNASIQVLNEGNPHKVTLPVQMAMQHYQQAEPAPVVERKPSLIDKYFHEVEQEFTEQTDRKRQLINQYSQTIAERVLMREGNEVVTEKSKSEKQARFMAAAAHDPAFAARTGIKQSVAKEFNKADTGTKQLSQAMKHKTKKVKENEIPGHSMGFTGGVGPGPQSNVAEAPIAMDPSEPNNPLIHSHQQANPATLKDRIARTRAQLKELAELADANDLSSWEHICKLAKGGMFMGLEQNLEQIRHGIEELAKKRKQGGVTSRGIDKNIGENVTKTIKPKKKTDPCWNDYHQVGVKMKNGKSVPNCVPKNK